MTYLVAEKFKSIQGEGLYAGTPMAFIRFVGCSVGKKICHFCDTDFDKPLLWRGGGTFNADQLLDWTWPYDHICLTGGEPLDQSQLAELCSVLTQKGETVHVETSGTKQLPDWMTLKFSGNYWICVSPKPGFLEDVVLAADEVKVIVPGLGSDESLPFKTLNTAGGSTNERLRWPTLVDALRWADAGKLVYLQPRNAKFDVDQHNLMLVKDLLTIHPQLRLSTQMHKILKVQ
jgi:organic radical activating enzyme